MNECTWAISDEVVIFTFGSDQLTGRFDGDSLTVRADVELVYRRQPGRHIYTLGMLLQLKPSLQRQRYLRTLARMSPEQRLAKAFELSEWSRKLFIVGLRERYADLGPDKLRDLYLERLRKCHSRPS